MDFWKCISEQSVIFVTCNTVRSPHVLALSTGTLCYSRRSLGSILAFVLKFELEIVNILAYYVYKCFLWQREQVPDDYSRTDPEHKLIYRFVRTLFSAAQLTAECAIVTLVRECQPGWLVCYTFNSTMRGKIRGFHQVDAWFLTEMLRHIFLTSTRGQQSTREWIIICPFNLYWSKFSSNFVMHCSPISWPVNVVLVVS